MPNRTVIHSHERGLNGADGDLTEAIADTLYPAKAATEAAIDRVDPGSTGTERERLRWRGGAPVLAVSLNFEVNDYLAIGGTIQDAIDDADAAGGGVVAFGDGTYDDLNLVVSGHGITFQGRSRFTTILRTDSGDLVTIPYNTEAFTCEHMRLDSLSGGGHVFAVTVPPSGEGGISHCRWHDIQAFQANNGKSVLYCHDGGTARLIYIDNVWDHVATFHTVAATVPTFDLRGLAINRNRWIDMRPTYSGNYTWWIETTSASSYALDNTIEGITGEIVNGGLVMLRGARSTRLTDIGIYDLGTTTKDLIVLGEPTVNAALKSAYSTLHNVQRYGGTLGGGLSDVKLDISGAWSITTFIDCGTNATPLVLDANTSRAIVINGQMTIANGDAVTVVDDIAGIKIGYGGWDGQHLMLGAYHLWVDSTGDLRISNGAPGSDTAGVVVGSQS